MYSNPDSRDRILRRYVQVPDESNLFFNNVGGKSSRMALSFVESISMFLTGLMLLIDYLSEDFTASEWLEEYEDWRN